VGEGRFFGCAEERSKEGNGGGDHDEGVFDNDPLEEVDSIDCPRRISYCLEKRERGRVGTYMYNLSALRGSSTRRS
jgi:hypothetical protein